MTIQDKCQYMILGYKSPTQPELSPRMWLMKDSAIDKLNALLFMGYAFCDLLTIDLNTKVIIGQERFNDIEAMIK